MARYIVFVKRDGYSIYYSGSETPGSMIYQPNRAKARILAWWQALGAWWRISEAFAAFARIERVL